MLRTCIQRVLAAQNLTAPSQAAAFSHSLLDIVTSSLLQQQSNQQSRLFSSSSSTSDIPSTDKILLKGLVFFGYHGVLPEERTLGQNFVIDTKLYTNLQKPGQTDNIDDTVNYAEVYNSIKTIIEGKPMMLLETVAERIARDVLESHKTVEAVTVKIEKPHVAVGGQLDALGIEITRKR